jgi:hypothetical protein
MVWHCLLVVQFWEMYNICNKKTKKIFDVWVDGELRLTFRMTFSIEMMQIWQELCAVVEDIRFGDESDTLVWCYTKSGTYTTQSFCAIINYRGITHSCSLVHCCATKNPFLFVDSVTQ